MAESELKPDLSCELSEKSVDDIEKQQPSVNREHIQNTTYVKHSSNHDGDASICNDPTIKTAVFSLTPRLCFILALMCSTNLCHAMVSSLIGPFFPHEAIIKGGSGVTIGLVMSSFDAARFLVAPVIGQYVAVIGPRFLLICGPFVISYTTIAFGFLGMAPPGAWFFILSAISRTLAGLGGISYSVTSISMQPILFGPHFGFAFVSYSQRTYKRLRRKKSM